MTAVIVQLHQRKRNCAHQNAASVSVVAFVVITILGMDVS